MPRGRRDNRSQLRLRLLRAEIVIARIGQLFSFSALSDCSYTGRRTF